MDSQLVSRYSRGKESLRQVCVDPSSSRPPSLNPIVPGCNYKGVTHGEGEKKMREEKEGKVMEGTKLTPTTHSPPFPPLSISSSRFTLKIVSVPTNKLITDHELTVSLTTGYRAVMLTMQ